MMETVGLLVSGAEQAQLICIAASALALAGTAQIFLAHLCLLREALMRMVSGPFVKWLLSYVNLISSHPCSAT